MKTVKEVSRLSGVSVRTLHHYDAIGLLKPSKLTEAGYRLYDNRALERLQLILLYRELRFPLEQIREILDSPGFDRDLALRQQIQLLQLQKEHLEQLLDLACSIQRTGVNRMDFSAFDTSKLDDYTARAREAWGNTGAYREYEEKAKGRSKEMETMVGAQLMDVFREFGAIRHQTPDCGEAQALVRKLQDYLTKHYYTCTPEILLGLSQMYGGGGEMTENIDRTGGDGTGAFAQRAIEIYCGQL